MGTSDSQKKLDEFKEVSLEYRYKDQMMVQELGFTITVIALVANGLLSKTVSLGYVCIQVAIGLFTIILARHLNHTNQDRRTALDRKENLRIKLNFESTHLGIGGKRLSAPLTMVWFANLLVLGWWAWCVITIYTLFTSGAPIR
jgi:hypothetical protein